MGFLDDLRAQAESSLGQVKSEIQSYVGARAVETIQSFVKVGPKPSGNLTPAEIAAGARGQTPPIAPPQSSSDNAGSIQAPSSIGSMEVMGVGLPILAAIGLGVFFIMRKRG